MFLRDVEAIIKEAEPVEPSPEPVTTVPVDQAPKPTEKKKATKAKWFKMWLNIDDTEEKKHVAVEMWQFQFVSKWHSSNLIVSVRVLKRSVSF